MGMGTYIQINYGYGYIYKSSMGMGTNINDVRFSTADNGFAFYNFLRSVIVLV